MSPRKESDTLLLVLDVCQRVVSLELAPEDALSKLQEIGASNPLLPSLLLDVLVVIEGDVQTSEKKEKAAQKFTDFVNMISDKIIPAEILRLELDVLDASLPANKQQLVRLKTRLYYKQAKYNLLREESEGYAKLITELMDSGGGLPAKTMMTRVLCLIGQFNLDPNRVIDIALECYECCVSQKDFYISLLKEIKANKDYLCTLLGFKYTFYHAAGKETPFSLYVVTSSLLREEMIDLMKITGFMVPKAEGIKETHRARAAKAGERARKAETILASNIPVDVSRNVNVDVMDTGQSITGVSFATVAAIQEADDAKLAAELNEDAVLSTNQKLGLVCALIEDGAWPLAKTLIDRLPEYYAVQASTRVSNAISDLIGKAIENFYLEKCSSRFEDLNLSAKRDSCSAGSVEQVTSWAGLASLTSMLWYVGPRLAYRPLIMTRLVRLITAFYREQPKGTDGVPADSPVARSMMDIVDEIVLPGLSLSEFNSGLSEEVWTLLQFFPYTWRYRLYGHWKFGNTMRHPEVNIVRGKVLGRTKYVLKRLSKETVRVMGRQLGKLCHVHPITVFDYLLSQVQTFDNLIQPVVESLKFLTNLEFDILTYCIIEQLASPDKQQLKASDGKLSPWLQALATLVGAVYKKYNVELAGMLNYVMNQLKNEKSFDLLVLREVIQNMACIEGVAGATADQLEALGGGELLRQEAGSFTNARNKRASARLRDAVLAGDIAVGLCILIAQQRECVVYRESSRLPLKLVGEMVDQCRDTLLQLGTFLWSNVRMDDYAQRIPPAVSLIQDYHLRIDAAMYLTRPTYLPKINSSYEAAKRAMKSESENKKMDTQQKFIFFKSAFDEVISKLINELEPCIPPHVCRDIPIRLFVVFWILSSYDIEVPTAAYERAIENIRRQMKEAADSPIMSKSKRMKEDERLRGLENKLRDEEKRQAEHVARIRAWFNSVKDDLFEAGRGQQTSSFIQTCVLPRVLFSESDAIYSAKLIIILHQQRITLFQSLVFIDKLFIDVLPLICALTENEANAIGTFLQILLSHAQRWHSDSAIFEKECEGFPGLVSKTRQDKTTESVNYESFRRLCFKWQMRLYTAFNSVLSVENNEYVQVRNCLVVMTKLAPCFPLLKDVVENVEKLAEKVRDTEKGKRDELSLKAASYLVRLKMRNVPIYEASQFHRPLMKHPVKQNSTLDRKRVAPTPTIEAKKKLKVEKPKVVERSEPERKELPKVEKKEKERKEEPVVVKEMKKETAEREEGEVPPSPPHKKVRAQSVEKPPANGGPKERKDVAANPPVKEVKEEKKEFKEPKEKREEEKKETRTKRDPTPSRKEEPPRDLDRRKDRGLDDEEIGPALPPTMREDRADDRKRDQKAHKRSARDEEQNGHSKVARKDREQIESRLSRPVSHDRRGLSPTREKERRDEKKDRRKESKPVRK
nr:THO complex subunit 2-like [Haemonchus contortus]